MSGALIGWLPLGRPVRLADGRHLALDAGSVDDWAHDLDVVPVLLGHDPRKPVGWVTKARVKLDRLYLFGELDDAFDPPARRSLGGRAAPFDVGGKCRGIQRVPFAGHSGERDRRQRRA